MPPRRVAPIGALCRAVLIATALTACKTKDAEPSHTPAPRVVEPASTGDSLAAEASAVADAIDPGRLAGLSDELPDWLLAAVGITERLPDDPAALRILADAEITAFDAMVRSNADVDGMLVGVMALARATIYSERAAVGGGSDPETLARLERVYRFIDAPVLASDRNLFVQILQLFVAVAASEGHVDDANKAELLGQAVFAAVKRAGPLHRRTVALLLRADAHHDAAPKALQAAGTSVRPEDDALAIRMATLAVDLRANDAASADWVALANLCHQALELECGTRALARARMLAGQATRLQGSDGAESIDEASTTAALAHRVVELADAGDFDARLERARGLMQLGRNDQAKAAFEALRRDHPKDARPVAGLAKHAVITRLDLQGANAIIDGAGTLDNADVDYYEIAIGTRAASLLSTAIPVVMSGDWIKAMAILTPMLARMKSDIAGLEALGQSDGRYLRFLFEVTMEALPLARRADTSALTGVMRSLLPRTAALQSEIPKHEHAYRLMLLATQFSSDRDAALAAARRPVPAIEGKRGELALRKIQALSDLAVAWDDAAIAKLVGEAIVEHSDSLPSGADKAVAAARAISSRLLGTDEWAATVQTYVAIVGDPGQSSDAVSLNNLAVAQAETGDLASAYPLWERAAQIGESWGDVAKLNLAVKRRGPGDDATLEELAVSGRAVVVRVAARAWLVEFATGAAARRKATQALRAAIKREAVSHVRPVLRPGTAGVVLEGSLEAGLGYGAQTGLQIQLDSVGTPWLTFPPPVPIVDPRLPRKR